ncbi:helix-turn-helix domain-containing protein [Hydrogenimonas urashimensis]|uniref:helix-turn-helix domain-containing protein n=1 Tax=Hydrogenimonas urashimensis TaxID=2740515 RepID=UPI00191623EA|nr:helix-turn-helix domain-containing protein [Hydrogenimonas urashimensis]
MSWDALSWASKQKTGKPQKKLLLLLLADRSNDDGYCWPSLNRIVADSELSKKTVIKYLKELEADGFIRIIHRTKDGTSLPNHYQINMNGVVKDAGGVVEDVHQGSVGATPGGSVGATPEPVITEPVREPHTIPSQQGTAKQDGQSGWRECDFSVEDVQHRKTAKPTGDERNNTESSTRPKSTECKTDQKEHSSLAGENNPGITARAREAADRAKATGVLNVIKAECFHMGAKGRLPQNEYLNALEYALKIDDPKRFVQAFKAHIAEKGRYAMKLVNFMADYVASAKPAKKRKNYVEVM